MKRLARVLKVVGFAGLFSSLALAQVFYLAKVPNSNPNTPTAINNLGEVVVNAGSSNALSVSLWNRVAGSQSLNVVGQNMVGSALNENGDVAGAGSETTSSQPQAFLWQSNNGTTHWLGTLGGPLSAAAGVNKSRQVVGTAYTAAGLPHAFLWTLAGGMQDLTPNLTSAGGAFATAINASGEVIGYYYPNGGSNVLGFIWTQAGGFVSFGNPGTLPFALNDAGTIVGQALTASGYRHAFSYTPAGGMVDLGTMGGSMSTALGINNNGWIVGTSLVNDGTGVLHGFLKLPSGGLQDFISLSKLASQKQPDSVQVNDFGDIAFSTKNLLTVLMPNVSETTVSSANPSKAGQAVTLTVTLSSIAGPPPDGEQLLVDLNGVQVGSGTIKNGVAKCQVTGLKTGTRTLTVIYNGDAYYFPFRYAFKQVVQ